MTATFTSDLAPVLQSVEQANGLPNAHYISEALFEEEKRSVLFANWVGIGFAADVPNPGDVKPVEFLGMPLLLVRDQLGELGVFQNTCRHRGMILVSEPTHIRKVIRCPYHSWCYGLDGALEATPHVGGPGNNTHDAIRREDLGLFRIPAEEYLGVIFANLSGTGPAFEKRAEHLKARWADFDQPVFHGGPESQFTLDVNTNWKLAVENYCESYHLPWIHPALNSYSKLQDHYHIEAPGDFSGQGTYVYRQLAAEDGSRFPDFDGIADQWATAAEYISMYPNVLLGVHRDHTFALILEPISVGRTKEHIALFYTEEGAHDARYGALRRRNAELWDTVFREDISVVEGMQAGRHGALFDGGRFSPAMDTPTLLFHQWVARQVQAGREQLLESGSIG